MDFAQRLFVLREQRNTLVEQLESLHKGMQSAPGGSAENRERQLEFDRAEKAIEEVDAQIMEVRLEEHRLGKEARPLRDFDDAGHLVARKGSGATPHSRYGIDVSTLQKALARSTNMTTGEVQLKTVLQGAGAGQLRPVVVDAGVKAVDSGFGAMPLVLALQIIPVSGGVFYYQELRPKVAPAKAGKQANEGDLKTRVEMESSPAELRVEQYAAYEKVSLQALADQPGILDAMEGILTNSVFRKADEDAWTKLVADASAITASPEAPATLLRVAARIAAVGGTGIRAVLNPLDYVEMLLQRETGGGAWLGLPPGATLPPIVQSTGVPAGKVVVSSGTDGAFVAMRESIGVAVGLSDDDFLRNLRSVLAEGRMAVGVRRPDYVYVGDLVEAP